MASNLPPEDHDGMHDNYVTHTYTFVERIKHWTGGVDDNMLMALQNAILLEAGKKMTGTLEKKVDEQQQVIHDSFISNAQALLSDSVISVSQHAQLVKKIIRSQTRTLDPKVLRDKFLNIKSVISNRLVPLLPLDYHALGSGKGIRDAFNALIVSVYIEMNQKKIPPHKVKELTNADVPFDFKFGKMMPANCILALMTNYTWAGLAEDVTQAMKVEKPKSRAKIKLEMAEEQAKKMKVRRNMDMAEKKRIRINSNVVMLQKSQLNKAFIVATQQSAWQQQAKVYKDTIDMMLAAGLDDGRVAELREKLVVHALDGPPDPPLTPPSLRKAQEEVVNLCDSDEDEFLKEDKKSEVDIKDLETIQKLMAAIESDNDSGSETQVMPGSAPDSPLVASIVECPTLESQTETPIVVVPPQATATAKADVENAKTITQVLDEHDTRSHGKRKKAPCESPCCLSSKTRSNKHVGA